MNQQPDNQYETYLRSLRLGLINRIRYEQDTGALHILDVGCHDGSMWDGSLEDVVVDGVDIDIEAIEKAKDSGVYREVHCKDIPNVSDYDVVMCCGVLEHVDDYWGFSQALLRANNIIMTVPNAWSFHRLVGLYMGMLREPEDLHDGDIAIGHKRVFNPNSWRDFVTIFANDGGFHTVESGSIGMKVVSSQQMIDIGYDAWNAFDEVGEDLALCGDNYYYGAELYAIFGRYS